MRTVIREAGIQIERWTRAIYRRRGRDAPALPERMSALLPLSWPRQPKDMRKLYTEEFLPK